MELTFSGVSKSYGKNKALSGFTATLTPGICALLGPNGAGKTTLMNVIPDNLKADAGTITFAADGEPPRDVREMGISFREKIGYMPQNPGLYRNFTAEEYLAYMAALKGIADGRKRSERKKEIAERIDEALRLVDLEPFRRRRVGALSGGMKQRLALAQAVLGDPSVVILDEPTAGLDPELRITVRNLLSSLGRNKIVIVSTHIVSDIENIADRVILLKRGVIVASGAPSDLVRGIAGKVWEVDVSADEASSIAEIYPVSSSKPISDSSFRMRVISNTPFKGNAYLVSPSLEDVYIAHFAKNTVLV